MNTTTNRHPTQIFWHSSPIRSVWAALFGGLFMPLGLTQLPLPQLSQAVLAPQALVNVAYAVGISLSAAALLLRRRPILPTLASMLVSAALADSVAWLGFAVWLVDHDTPTFPVLLIMAIMVFWLIRPRANEKGES